MRISDWSSDVCSSDLGQPLLTGGGGFEAIDPMVFADAKSGKTYIYAGGSAGSTLRVFVLTPDLLTIDHEVKVAQPPHFRSDEHTSELQSLMRISYAVFCLKKKTRPIIPKKSQI